MPSLCTRMFLGLKSPRTSVRSFFGSRIDAISDSTCVNEVGVGPGDRAVIGIDAKLVEKAGVR